MSTTGLHPRPAVRLGNLPHLVPLRIVVRFLLVVGIVTGANLAPKLPWLLMCIAIAGIVFVVRFLATRSLRLSVLTFLAANTAALVIWWLAGVSLGRGLYLVPSVLFVLLMRDMRENVASLSILVTFLLGFFFASDTIQVFGEEPDTVVSLMLLSFLFVINRSGPGARLRTVLLSSVSFFWDGRRYFYLVALMVGVFFRTPLRRPFLFGAIVSATFPIAAFLISTQETYYYSLWARYRQVIFIWDTIYEHPIVLFLGSAWVDIDLPYYFWAGDTKFIGSVFEYGLVFVAVNVLLLIWISRHHRVSAFQKFLLGIIALGYLGADPMFFSLAMLLSFIRR